MRLYVSFNSVPELRDLPVGEQKRLWSEARDRLIAKHAWTMIATFVVFLVGLLLVGVLVSFMLPRAYEVGVNLTLLSLAGAFTIVSLQLHLDACRPIFREIRERDYGESWQEACDASRSTANRQVDGGQE